MSSDAIGASFTAVTVIVNVPVSIPPSPSLTVYVIIGTVPFQLAFGVNVYVPFALTIIVPTAGIETLEPAGYVYVVPPTVNEICVTSRFANGVSVSVSFVKIFPVAGVSSLTVFESLLATGASFTGSTNKLKTAVSVELPSLTVYVINGTVPV